LLLLVASVFVTSCRRAPFVYLREKGEDVRVLLFVIVSVLVANAVCPVQAQEQQKQPQQWQQGQQGRQGWRGAVAWPPELREKAQKLWSLDQKLAEAEKTAMDTEADLKTSRQNIQVLLEEVAKQVRELEEKTDDAVMKANPELEASVKEKRTLLAELEDQMGQYKNRLWLMRLGRLFGAGPGRGGWPPGGQRPPGAGQGGPQPPPAEQPK
jgi:hypothetical protein